MKPDIKAVIFDMDGVLLDSETLSDRTWDLAAEEYNLKDINLLKNPCRGRNRQDIAQMLKDHYGSDFPAMDFLNRTSEIFYKIEDEGGLHLMPYAKEILEYLKPKYKLALASSTRQKSVYRQMTNLGLFDFFETITCGDMVTHSKPDPEIYKIAYNSISIAPENCIAVEDSLAGIKSAHSAGMNAIMIPDRTQPTEEIIPLCYRIFNSLKDLESIL